MSAKIVKSANNPSSSTLYVVATPIGNLEDLTPRARRVLSEVDVIAAEDTRVTKKLLLAAGITPVAKRWVSYRDETEAKETSKLITEMTTSVLGVALVSDAGTPCISDPGFRLTEAAHAAGITVCPIAGPSALTTLASASGLSCARLLFVGFLPTKKSERAREFSSWSGMSGSVVFFESLNRLENTLEEIAKSHPTVRCVVGRELTKMFEEIVSRPIADVLAWAKAHTSLRGECAVMVSGFAAVEQDLNALEDDVRMALQRGMSAKEVVRLFKDRGMTRNDLYKLVLKLSDH